jgi:molybdate transport system ATP-binding protein
VDAAAREELSAVLERVISAGTAVVLVARADSLPAWVTHVLELPPGERRGVSETCKPAIASTSALRPDARQDPVIELRDVIVRYGSRTILDRVNWIVRAGERWALLGPNGSGKTTLLSLLCGDHPQAYAQDVRVFGRRRGTGETIWELKRRIGLSSSELHLYFAEPLTAAETVATGFYDVLARRAATVAQDAAARGLLVELRLGPAADRRFDRLSTGEQRLTLLARALVKRPEVLILDEPFQGLDVATAHRVRDWLDGWLAPAQTLVFVTHHADEVPRSVTQTLALDRGHVSSVRDASQKRRGDAK